MWRDEGHRSAAAWMAETTGTALGDALAVLDTAGALAGVARDHRSPAPGGAVGLPGEGHRRRGHPSPQAPSASCSTPRPARASRPSRNAPPLVRAAATSAQEEAARYLAIHRRRSLRHWADPDGALRLDARLTPDAGAKLLSVLQVEADARFAQARRAREQEPPGAYRADALVALVTGEAITKDPSSKDSSSKGSRPGPRATVCIRVDATALERGYVARRRDLCHRRGGPGARGRAAGASSPTPLSRSSCTEGRGRHHRLPRGTQCPGPRPKRARRARPEVRGAGL